MDSEIELREPTSWWHRIIRAIHSWAKDEDHRRSLSPGEYAQLRWPEPPPPPDPPDPGPNKVPYPPYPPGYHSSGADADRRLRWENLSHTAEWLLSTEPDKEKRVKLINSLIQFGETQAEGLSTISSLQKLKYLCDSVDSNGEDIMS